jgi:hypothetical protein
MNQLKIFIGLCMCAVAIAFGFLLVGWWMLIPFAGGALWAIAGERARASARAKPSKPHPSCVASQPSKPASTVTWQETVEAIERARPVKPDHGCELHAKPK